MCSSQPQSIVVVSKKNNSGTVFEFESAFDYLQIDGIYDTDTNTLVDVHIRVVAPGHSAVTLGQAESYLISTAEGTVISFDLENGYVKGSVSFKYGSRDGRRDIFATYSVHLPYAGDLKGTVNIAPTEVTEATGFTVTQLKDIVHFSPSELKDVEEKALVSKYGQPSIRALNAANEKEFSGEQALFVKFLKDFVVDQDGVVVIETCYPPSDEEKTLVTKTDDKSSKQWHGTISFLGILELDASVDPKTLTILATLFSRIPIIGRIQLSKVQGSLLGGGVTAEINVAVAKGKVTFSASKNKDGKYDLYVDAELDIKHYRTIKTKGKKRIVALPVVGRTLPMAIAGREPGGLVDPGRILSKL